MTHDYNNNQGHNHYQTSNIHELWCIPHSSSTFLLGKLFLHKNQYKHIPHLHITHLLSINKAKELYDMVDNKDTLYNVFYKLSIFRQNQLISQ